MKADLHCHSIYSDGTLTPTEVVNLAHENEVDLLALTDHDSIEGLTEAQTRCNELGIKLLKGVEVSVSWNEQTIHIVGLNIDTTNAEITQLLIENQIRRESRVQIMVDKLADIGIDVSAELDKMIPEKGLITRTHLARALMNMGEVNKMDKAFKKYLGKGKKAYVGGD